MFFFEFYSIIFRDFFDDLFFAYTSEYFFLTSRKGKDEGFPVKAITNLMRFLDKGSCMLAVFFRFSLTLSEHIWCQFPSIFLRYEKVARLRAGYLDNISWFPFIRDTYEHFYDYSIRHRVYEK